VEEPGKASLPAFETVHGVRSAALGMEAPATVMARKAGVSETTLGRWNAGCSSVVSQGLSPGLS